MYFNYLISVKPDRGLRCPLRRKNYLLGKQSCLAIKIKKGKNAQSLKNYKTK